MTSDAFPRNHSWASGNTVYCLSPVCKLTSASSSSQWETRPPQACLFLLSNFSVQIYVALRIEVRTFNILECNKCWKYQFLHGDKVCRHLFQHSINHRFLNWAKPIDSKARQRHLHLTVFMPKYSCITTGSPSIAIHWLNCKPWLGRFLLPNTSPGSGLSLLISCFAQCRKYLICKTLSSSHIFSGVCSKTEINSCLLFSFSRMILIASASPACLSQIWSLPQLDYVESPRSTHLQPIMSGLMQRFLICFNHTLELKRLYLPPCSSYTNEIVYATTITNSCSFPYALGK